MRSFAKIEPPRNGENTLSFTDVGKSCQSRELFTWQIVIFLNCIRETNILAKFSEFTCTLNHDSTSLDVNHWMHFI